MSTLAEIADSRELLVNLTRRELSGQYKRSVLGWAWSLINPLVTMGIFTVVFGLLLKAKPAAGDPSGLDSFALWLMTAYLPWTFLSEALTGGANALVANGNLVKKVYFPREDLVISAALQKIVTFLIAYAVLAIVLLIVGNMVLPWLPVVLLITALLLLFATGLALGLSVLNVYFRDVGYLLGLGLQVWFYATPIVYPLTIVAKHAKADLGPFTLYQLYLANPMTRFAIAYRNAFYDLRMPALSTWAWILGWTAVSLAAGWAVFRRLEGRLAEEL